MSSSNRLASLNRRAGLPEDEPLFSNAYIGQPNVARDFDNEKFYYGPNGCLLSIPEYAQSTVRFNPTESVDEWMAKNTLPCPIRDQGVAYLGLEADLQPNRYPSNKKWHQNDHIYAPTIVERINAGDPQFVVLDRANGGIFWRGPYGCLVPFWIRHCVAEDGGNTRGIDGGETEVYVENPMSRHEWLAKYTVPLEVRCADLGSSTPNVWIPRIYRAPMNRWGICTNWSRVATLHGSCPVSGTGLDEWRVVEQAEPQGEGEVAGQLDGAAAGVGQADL